MIKILFLDTSALLSFFISDKGTPAMRWLISSDNKAHNAIRYVINKRVINEFKTELDKLVARQALKQSTADNILALFNTHYKNQKFKVVGTEASVSETIDGMYHFLGKLARPLLVSSSTQHETENSTYKIINPHIHNSTEIKLILQGKNQSQKDSLKNTKFYRRFFNKTRLAIAL